MIRLYDYILIIDKDDSHYLEIGEVVDIEYEHGGYINEYTVRFKNDVMCYRYLEDSCEVLMFKPR